MASAHVPCESRTWRMCLLLVCVLLTTGAHASINFSCSYLYFDASGQLQASFISWPMDVTITSDKQQLAYGELATVTLTLTGTEPDLAAFLAGADKISTDCNQPYDYVYFVTLGPNLRWRWSQSTCPGVQFEDGALRNLQRSCTIVVQNTNYSGPETTSSVTVDFGLGYPPPWDGHSFPVPGQWDTGDEFKSVSLVLSPFIQLPVFQVTATVGSVSLPPCNIFSSPTTCPNVNITLGQSAKFAVNAFGGAAQVTAATLPASQMITSPTDAQFTTSRNTPTVLFSDKVLLGMPITNDFSNNALTQTVFGIHSGTTQLTLQFNFLGQLWTAIVPVHVSNGSDGITSLVTVGTIGGSNTAYDSLIFKYADRNGVPPQLIKAQVDEETACPQATCFDPMTFRYEPITGDFSPLVTSGFSLLTDTRYASWALARSEDCTTVLAPQGTQLVLSSLDANRREQYKLALESLTPDQPWCVVLNREWALGSPTRKIKATDKLPSAENVFYTNDDIFHWGPEPKNVTRLSQAFYDYNWDDPPFTAQTVLGASYGLHQVMYTTAVGDEGFVDNQGVGLPPHLLFQPSVSLDLGTGYFAAQFQASIKSKSSGVSVQTSYANEADLLTQFGPALKRFNGGPKATFTVPQAKKCSGPPSEYVCNVLFRVPRYDPLP